MKHLYIGSLKHIVQTITNHRSESIYTSEKALKKCLN